MRPLADSGRMSAIEEACRARYGLDDRTLMERAAAALESSLRTAGLLKSDTAICALAGRGNNGGDGLALASRLAKAGMRDVSAIHIMGKLSAECAFRLEEAAKAGVRLIPWPEERVKAAREIDGAGLLLDAVAGTGLSSALRESEADLAILWNRAKGRKVAIDLPSGFRRGMESDDPVFDADETVCIGLVKECLFIPAFRRKAGKIKLAPPGVFPEETLEAAPGGIIELEERDMGVRLRPFDSDAYKYSRGSVSVFAGSREGLGAAMLCAEAAARTGAGLVRISVDPDIWQAAAACCGGLVVKATESGADGLTASEKAEAGKASCIVAGPGWGRKGPRKTLLGDILSLGRPVVLDADALSALGDISPDPNLAPAVITPHFGEAARLLKGDSRSVSERPAEAARELAATFRCAVILKGNVNWISDSNGELRVFDASFPPLACAGSGDVLAGMTGGLLARGLSAFDAACSAVLLHYRAGRLAWESGGYFMAQDLCREVSRAAAEAEGEDSYVR